MKEILLTQGQVALVDDEDYDEINQYKWCVAYYPNVRDYRAMRWEKHRIVRMSRAIMGAQDGEQVDHRNHDTLDNRRANLRLCNNSQNQHNRRRRHVAGSSLYKGVSRHGRKWRARINLDGQCYHLGYFDDEFVAALIYDSAARKMHGEFALLNFPTE